MKSVREDIREEEDDDEKAELKAYLLTLKEKVKDANAAVTAAAEITVKDYFLAEQEEAATRRKQQEEAEAAAAAIDVDKLVDISPIVVVGSESPVQSQQPAPTATSAKRGAGRGKTPAKTPATPDTTGAPAVQSISKKPRKSPASFERTSSGRGQEVAARKSQPSKKRKKKKSRRDGQKDAKDDKVDDWEEGPLQEGVVLSLKRKRRLRNGDDEVSMPLACLTWIVQV